MKPQSSPAKPGKYLRTKSNANRRFPGTFVLTLLLLFAGMCFFSARWYLKTYGQRLDYCKKLLTDPVIRQTPLKFSLLDIPWKQKIIMLLVRLKCSVILAAI